MIDEVATRLMDVDAILHDPGTKAEQIIVMVLDQDRGMGLLYSGQARKESFMSSKR